MSSMVPDDAPKPRLSHVAKRADFQGYGFNLHAEKGKAGQYIGKVDENSPAELAGLLQGDRIVEVNGTNIGNENHQQVVQRIKAVPDETKLLVVDSKADAYYKEKRIVVRGDMPGVVCLPAGSAEVTQAEVITEASTVETIAQVNHVGAPAVNGEAHRAQDDRQQEEIAVNGDFEVTTEEVSQEVSQEPLKDEEAVTPPPEYATTIYTEDIPPPREDTPPPREDTPPLRADTPPPEPPQFEEEAAATEVTVTKVETTETKVESAAGDATTSTTTTTTVVEETTPEPLKDPEPTLTTTETVIIAEAVKEAESAPVVQEKSLDTETAAAAVVVAAAAASESEPVVEVEAKAAEPEPAVEYTPPPAEPAKPRDPNDPFAVSAAEMRERLKKGGRNKNDVKSANLSTIDKYQMYQRL